MLVQMWTDGGMNRSNPGPGGWAAILVANNKARIVGGFEPTVTTNNRMELTAVIRGFQALIRPAEVELFTDSQYVLFGLRRVLWRNHDLLVRNEDLWTELSAAVKAHRVRYTHVKGHAGERINEQADYWAGVCARTASTVDLLYDDANQWLSSLENVKRGKRRTANAVGHG